MDNKISDKKIYLKCIDCGRLIPFEEVSFKRCHRCCKEWKRRELIINIVEMMIENSISLEEIEIKYKQTNKEPQEKFLPDTY